MPVKPKRPCSQPGCRELVDKGKCQAHQVKAAEQSKIEVRRYDQQRGTAASRGYDSRWAAYSRQYRKEHPLCVDCEARGVLTSVEHGGHVDHIVAVSGPDDPLFWEPCNHASRCQSCHSRKTASEDGAFGNARGKGRVRADCGLDGVPVDQGHHWRKG